MRIILLLMAVVLLAGCSSEPAPPEYIRFNLSGNAVNCIRWDNALSCNFQTTTTTTTPASTYGNVDGCDKDGCYILFDGVKEYMPDYVSTTIPVSTTTTTLPPEGLLDLRRKFHRFLGE